MELYIVTKTNIQLEDGYYNKETKEVSYRRKTEWFETKEKAFASYIKAAKYIRELLIEENSHYGDVFAEEDMNKWSAFFIGFHHGCQLKRTTPPIVAKWYESNNVLPPSNLVKYEIKTISVDYEVLNESEEILKELA